MTRGRAREERIAQEDYYEVENDQLCDNDNYAARTGSRFLLVREKSFR
ncbi:MAG: hypothetical protein WCF90_02565 [Methanomicrobiales archaeon]